ncbi:hypothetical protein [Leifsonia sp. EB34]|uniref:hypothetical protein n=1 Tax=Leifsonia sp. EB34 TaxID=3156303 RepID=UPI00351105E8
MRFKKIIEFVGEWNRPIDRAKPKKLRSRLAAGVAFALLASCLSLGAAAPAATAATSEADAYELTVDGHVTTIAEGETVVYGMEAVNSPTLSQRSPRTVYPGNAGTLTVTASAGVYYFSVAMSVPATNFVGNFSITDLTSGFSGGSTLELVFSGSVPTSKLRGHRYSGTLSGTAFFMGAAVAKTVPNNTLYTYP